MKIVFVALFFLLSTHCALTASKRAPEPASSSVRREFDQIQIDIAAGAEKRALTRLRKLVATHPNTDVSDDAYMQIGRIYFKAREYQLAYDAFIAVVNSDIFSPNEAEALLGASRSLYRLGRIDESLALSQKSLKIPGLSNEMRLEIYKSRYVVLAEMGDRLDALRALVYIAEKDPDASSREGHKIKALDFVESRLTSKELDTVIDSSEFGFARGHAIFKRALTAYEQRDFARARDLLQSAIRILDSAEQIEQANSLLNQIDSRRQVDSRTIGAVLPLTGRQSQIAQKTLRGLQLGLGIYGADKSDLRLAVVDSEGHPDVARRAVERLVTEDHVIAIVGSLLSKTATAVASKADELGVPSIALSQKAGITEVGKTVFRNSLTSEMQVRYLVEMAMEKMQLKRFAILYPNDPYGVEFANLFWDEVLARGGKIAAVQAYRPNETDFSGPVKRLVGKYYIEDRQQEYKARITEWYKQQKSVNIRRKPPEDLLPAIVDFDAIFIPDGIRSLGQIAPTLTFYNINNVRLLGTNLWNAEEFLARLDKSCNGAIFVDSMLSSDSAFTQSRFYKEFHRVFGEAPSIFEAQAYDAGLMIRQALAAGNRTRLDLTEQLEKLKGFPGALGKLNYFQPREIDRPVVALTINEGRVALLSDPAPVSAPQKPQKNKLRR